MMRQCLLEQRAPFGPFNRTLWQVAWIPQEFAQARKILDLKIGGEWEEGWKVSRVYDQHRQYTDVREHQKIDLPSIH